MVHHGAAGLVNPLPFVFIEDNQRLSGRVTLLGPSRLVPARPLVHGKRSALDPALCVRVGPVCRSLVVCFAPSCEATLVAQPSVSQTHTSSRARTNNSLNISI